MSDFSFLQFFSKRSLGVGQVVSRIDGAEQRGLSLIRASALPHRRNDVRLHLMFKVRTRSKADP